LPTDNHAPVRLGIPEERVSERGWKGKPMFFF
jgi:hypothetical protein